MGICKNRYKNQHDNDIHIILAIVEYTIQIYERKSQDYLCIIFLWTIYNDLLVSR